jgi:hypothetical protein
MKKKSLPKPPLKNDRTQKVNLLFETNEKRNLRFKGGFVFAFWR